MATTMNAAVHWGNTETRKTNFNIWKKWMAFADSQSKNKLLWFLVSLIFQGVFFLPMPAILTFYFGAPIYLLVVTLSLFFANVIAGMGGSGIRTILSLFALSVIIHLCMMLIYVF